MIVKEYFPDVKQFYDKSKSLIAEGCLSNKEVYRLKMIVRKVGMDLNENEN